MINVTLLDVGCHFETLPLIDQHSSKMKLELFVQEYVKECQILVDASNYTVGKKSNRTCNTLCLPYNYYVQYNVCYKCKVHSSLNWVDVCCPVVVIMLSEGKLSQLSYYIV